MCVINYLYPAIYRDLEGRGSGCYLYTFSQILYPSSAIHNNPRAATLPQWSSLPVPGRRGEQKKSSETNYTLSP